MVGTVTSPAGDSDAWVARFNPLSETILWQARYGGAGDDGANDLAVAADGHLVVVGVTGARGSGRQHDSAAEIEAVRSAPSGTWILKLNAANGSVTWLRNFGTGDEGLHSLVGGSAAALIAVGATVTTDRQADGLVMVLDPDGLVTGSCDLVTPADFDATPTTRTLTTPAVASGVATSVVTHSVLAAASTSHSDELCPCTTCRVDAWEPDDWPDLETSDVDPSVTQSRNFRDDALDWLLLNACASESYTFETSGLAPRTDTVLEVLASDGAALLAGDDDGGTGVASRIVWTPSSSGLRYLRVREKDASIGRDAGYRLDVTGYTATCEAWARTAGGAANDIPTSVSITDDGGVVIAGYSTPVTSGNDDAWVVQLDALGAIAWQKRFGGTASDRFQDMVRDWDGTLYLAGTTYGGSPAKRIWTAALDEWGGLIWKKDLSDVVYPHNSLELTALVPSSGFLWPVASGPWAGEAWLLSLDPDDGNSVGTGSIESTNDSLVFQAGAGSLSQPNSGVITGYAERLGSQRALVVATLPLIDLSPRWSAGSSNQGFDVQNTADGAVVVAGSFRTSPSGNEEAWVLKVRLVPEAGGFLSWSIDWQRSYGGPVNERARTILQTRDGGYVVGGATSSFGNGGEDLWLLRLDGSGGILWQKAFGGAGNEEARGLIETPEGGFVVVGTTTSYGAGGTDLWILRLDAAGNGLDGCALETATNVVPGAPTVTSEGLDWNLSYPTSQILAAGFSSVAGGFSPVEQCTIACRDADVDVFNACSGDCDDSRASIYPGAPQLCDGLANNCGIPWPSVPPDEIDNDGDGYVECSPWVGGGKSARSSNTVIGGGDCDDTYAATYPDAAESNDGRDNQCPGDRDYGIVDEISGTLGFLTAGNKNRLSWPPQSGATLYEVARADRRDFSVGCTVMPTAAPFLDDPELPAPGAAFYYLARAVAPHVGSWGKDSHGVERALACGGLFTFVDTFNDNLAEPGSPLGDLTGWSAAIPR